MLATLSASTTLTPPCRYPNGWGGLPATGIADTTRTAVRVPERLLGPPVSRHRRHHPLRRELRELEAEVARDAPVVLHQGFQVQTLYLLAALTDARILAHRQPQTATGPSPWRSSSTRCLPAARCS